MTVESTETEAPKNGRPLSYEEAQKVYSLRLTPCQYEVIVNNFGTLKDAILHLVKELSDYAGE